MKVMENSLFVLPDRRDGARSLLEGKSELVWSCEAESHFEAMTKYYAYQEWGAYTTEFEQDHWPYFNELGETRMPNAR
jgi:hypothetical protein